MKYLLLTWKRCMLYHRLKVVFTAVNPGGLFHTRPADSPLPHCTEATKGRCDPAWSLSLQTSAIVGRQDGFVLRSCDSVCSGIPSDALELLPQAPSLCHQPSKSYCTSSTAWSCKSASTLISALAVNCFSSKTVTKKRWSKCEITENNKSLGEEEYCMGCCFKTWFKRYVVYM